MKRRNLIFILIPFVLCGLCLAHGTSKVSKKDTGVRSTSGTLLATIDLPSHREPKNGGTTQSKIGRLSCGPGNRVSLAGRIIFQGKKSPISHGFAVADLGKRKIISSVPIQPDCERCSGIEIASNKEKTFFVVASIRGITAIKMTPKGAKVIWEKKIDSIDFSALHMKFRVSKDGRRVLVERTQNEKPQVLVFDARTGKPVKHKLSRLSPLPDKNDLGAIWSLSDKDSTFTRFIKGKTQKLKYPKGLNWVSRVKPLDNQHFLADSGEDGKLWVLKHDGKSVKVVRKLETGGHSFVHEPQLSKPPNLVAVMQSSGNELFVYDVKKGTRIHKVTLGGTDPFASFQDYCFMPDGRFVAATRSKIYVWKLPKAPELTAKDWWRKIEQNKRGTEKPKKDFSIDDFIRAAGLEPKKVKKDFYEIKKWTEEFKSGNFDTRQKASRELAKKLFGLSKDDSKLGKHRLAFLSAIIDHLADKNKKAQEVYQRLAGAQAGAVQDFWPGNPKKRDALVLEYRARLNKVLALSKRLKEFIGYLR